MKIAIVDLDDVLCISTKVWVDFANEKTSNRCNNLIELKKTLDYAQYKKLKYEYRTSGIKATLPIMQGVKELIGALKRKNYTIIIMTARPIYDIPEVFRDTLSWLKKNNIQHDLLFGGGKNKHLKILKYFPMANFMIEDNHETANAVAQQGYKVFLLDNQYNQHPLHKGVKRVFSLKEIEV